MNRQRLEIGFITEANFENGCRNADAADSGQCFEPSWIDRLRVVAVAVDDEAEVPEYFLLPIGLYNRRQSSAAGAAWYRGDSPQEGLAGHEPCEGDDAARHPRGRWCWSRRRRRRRRRCGRAVRLSPVARHDLMLIMPATGVADWAHRADRWCQARRRRRWWRWR